MDKLWTQTSESIPQEDGEYLVIVKSVTGFRFPEICYYDVRRKEFSCWDFYNDEMVRYKHKQILYWLKIPDYKE